MKLEEEILREHSKRQVLRIASWIGKDPGRMGQLMKLFLHGEPVISQPTAWIIGYTSECNPRLLRSWLKPMLKKFRKPGVHDAVKRNVTKALLTADIPRSLLGAVITLCFDELASPASPIAVRANAMKVLSSIAMREPDIRRELRATLEQLLPHAGPGLRACGRNVLQQIPSGPTRQHPY